MLWLYKQSEKKINHCKRCNHIDISHFFVDNLLSVHRFICSNYFISWCPHNSNKDQELLFEYHHSCIFWSIFGQSLNMTYNNKNTEKYNVCIWGIFSSPEHSDCVSNITSNILQRSVSVSSSVIFSLIKRKFLYNSQYDSNSAISILSRWLFSL